MARRGLGQTVVVLVQLGPVLVGFGAHEAVKTPETLAQRPALERPDGCYVFYRREVPFAQGHRGVALGAQDGREHGRRFRDPAVIAGEARRQFHYRPDAHGVMVAARQEGGTGGRAHRINVEIVVHEAG